MNNFLTGTINISATPEIVQESNDSLHNNYTMAHELSPVELHKSVDIENICVSSPTHTELKRSPETAAQVRCCDCGDHVLPNDLQECAKDESICACSPTHTELKRSPETAAQLRCCDCGDHVLPNDLQECAKDESICACSPTHTELKRSPETAAQLRCCDCGDHVLPNDLQECAKDESIGACSPTHTELKRSPETAAQLRCCDCGDHVLPNDLQECAKDESICACSPTDTELMSIDLQKRTAVDLQSDASLRYCDCGDHVLPNDLQECAKDDSISVSSLKTSDDSTIYSPSTDLSPYHYEEIHDGSSGMSSSLEFLHCKDCSCTSCLNDTIETISFSEESNDCSNRSIDNEVFFTKVMVYLFIQ